ncbi:unnamed protein product [Debaryomyces fabryi]|nr:unnamed protein product [Debaryomyces fabryi]
MYSYVKQKAPCGSIGPMRLLFPDTHLLANSGNMTFMQTNSIRTLLHAFFMYEFPCATYHGIPMLLSATVGALCICISKSCGVLSGNNRHDISNYFPRTIKVRGNPF